MKGKSPGRFKFTLKDDYEFNYSVIIDILYLEGKPVLQVIDAATSFGAARFLKDMSARNAWDTLRACWIDAYQGPPDYVVHDAGKNFTSTEFKQLASSMSIEVKEVPVEAHNSVGKVERYHAPLRRAYEILREELNSYLRALGFFCTKEKLPVSEHITHCIYSALRMLFEWDCLLAL